MKKWWRHTETFPKSFTDDPTLSINLVSKVLLYKYNNLFIIFVFFLEMLFSISLLKN